MRIIYDAKGAFSFLIALFNMFSGGFNKIDEEW